MTPKGADLEATDLIEVSTIESGSYVTRSITGQELIDAIPAPTGFVPTSRTLTINGVAQDLSADRSWTIATGLTVGTTPIASGTIGRVLFEGTGNVLQQSSSLAYDDSTKAFSIVANQNATTSLTLSNNSTGSSSLITSTLISDTAVGNSLLYGSGRVNNNVNQYQTGASYIIDYQGPVSLNLSSTFASGSNSGIRFWTASSTSNGVERMRIASTGNVLINTTTDAGFRLDVNGTARVSGALTASGSIISNGTIRVTATTASPSGNASFFVFDGAEGTNFAYDYGTATYRALAYNGSLVRFLVGGTERGRFAATTGNVLINTTTDAGFRLDVNGTARVATSILVGSSSTQGTIQTGVFRGTFFNDYANNFTIFQVQTSGNVSFYNSVAIGTTSAPSASKLRVVGLPTSSAGLSSGDVWNDGGTLKIV
jgi:hypothetical protein